MADVKKYSPRCTVAMCRRLNQATASIWFRAFTRSGIGSFSDWAVGGRVSPTAITLRSIGATSSTSPLAFMLFATALIVIGLVIVWQRKR